MYQFGLLCNWEPSELIVPPFLADRVDYVDHLIADSLELGTPVGFNTSKYAIWFAAQCHHNYLCGRGFLPGGFPLYISFSRARRVAYKWKSFIYNIKTIKENLKFGGGSN